MDRGARSQKAQKKTPEKLDGEGLTLGRIQDELRQSFDPPRLMMSRS